MTRITKLVAGVASAAALCASAKTTTWTGASSGTFTAAANYDNGAPEPGDEVVFPDSKVTLAEEAFDFGASGITLRVPKELASSVKFAGSGRIVKLGAGALRLTAASTSTGGVLVGDGSLTPALREGETLGGGTGEVVLSRQEDASETPYLDLSVYDARLSNPIRIVTGRTDLDSPGSIEVGNPLVRTLGPVTAEDDFLIRQNFSVVSYASISAPGRTVTLAGRAQADWRGAYLNVAGAIDADVVVTRKPSADDLGSVVRFSGVSTAANRSLTVSAGTNELAAAARWAGKSVSVGGGGARLKLSSSDNLTGLPQLSVEDGGVLELPSGVVANVSTFTVAGAVQAAGLYGAADFPGTIQGEGRICVLPETAHYWVGGASGAWNEASSWDPAAVPGADATVVFTNASFVSVGTADETVDFGAGGLTVIATGGSVAFNVSFAGVGALRLLGAIGAGYLRLNAKSVHSGGTEIRLQGAVQLDGVASGQLGTGPVHVWRLSDSSPCLWLLKWGMTLPNDIFVHGDITAERGAVYASNEATVSGAITGDGDFLIRQDFGSLTLRGAVTAAGTVHVRNDNASRGFAVSVNGDVSGAVVRDGGERTDQGVVCPAAFPVEFRGRVGDDPEKPTSFLHGTNRLMAASVCASREVRVAGETTVLELAAKGNLSPETDMTVSGGAKLNVAAGVRIRLATLSIDGVSLSPGRYTKANCPTCIGDGSITVGHPGALVIIR